MSNTFRSIRLYINQPLNASAEIVLNTRDSQYLGKVMRCQPGDNILLFNGYDGEWRAALTEIESKKAVCKLTEQTRRQCEETDLWFAFAPVKRARLDFIAQKVTELGVSRILPIKTERTIITRVKTSRLVANAKEAAEQCERLTLPVVEEFQPLSNFLKAWPTERKLLFCDEEKSDPLANEALLRVDSKPASWLWGLLIGPEGGFTDRERQQIRALDVCVPVSLGPRILRSDTAGVAALALWQAALGDW